MEDFQRIYCYCEKDVALHSGGKEWTLDQSQAFIEIWLQGSLLGIPRMAYQLSKSILKNWSPKPTKRS